MISNKDDSLYHRALCYLVIIKLYFLALDKGNLYGIMREFCNEI